MSMVSTMIQTRRAFVGSMTGAATAAFLPQAEGEGPGTRVKKRHIITLSFDDGFRKSFVRVAQIYENREVSACLNVIAIAHRKDFSPPDEYIGGVELGDFALWN